MSHASRNGGRRPPSPFPPLALAVSLAATACGGPGLADSDRSIVHQPRRVVLFVADGAGVAYWSAAFYASDSLVLTDFPVVGLFDPRNTSLPVPESASSATALATGVRTFSHAVGVGPDSLPRKTVLEAAKERGLATGLVTTTHLTDATPAAFAAHVADRGQRLEIARQMADLGIEVLLGDGRAAFDPARRPDSLNLISKLRLDHLWIGGAGELESAAAADSVGGIVGFFSTDREFVAARRRPSLAAMTAAALRVLDRDPEGWFLLVENEHSDHLGHENQPLSAIVDEMLHLESAVRVAVDYQRDHPSTLIVVIGDHETGGLDLLSDSTGALVAAWATTGHSAELVPVFARGPGAERFGGIRTAAGIGRALLEAVAGAAPDAPPPAD